ncbi:hypothetical protein [Actinoplanes sp. NPDC026619]|uniref:hypothetical protein n=1 Tax=Actinoplanes sp. NPDC026619 TaxID=3155798 RepID=UPI0033DA8F1B
MAAVTESVPHRLRPGGDRPPRHKADGTPVGTPPDLTATELESLLRDGTPADVADVLLTLPEAARRTLSPTVFFSAGPASAGPASAGPASAGLTEGAEAALLVAGAACLPRTDAIVSWLRSRRFRHVPSAETLAELIRVLGAPGRPSLASIAAALTDRMRSRPAWPGEWPVIAAILLAAGTPPPTSDPVLRAWIRDHAGNPVTLADRLAADPWLDHLLPYLFDSAGLDRHWPPALVQLTTTGRLDRNHLIGLTLHRLRDGGTTAALRPAIATHDLLAPTPQEITKHRKNYAALLDGPQAAFARRTLEPSAQQSPPAGRAHSEQPAVGTPKEQTTPAKASGSTRTKPATPADQRSPQPRRGNKRAATTHPSTKSPARAPKATPATDDERPPQSGPERTRNPKPSACPATQTPAGTPATGSARSPQSRPGETSDPKPSARPATQTPAGTPATGGARSLQSRPGETSDPRPSARPATQTPAGTPATGGARLLQSRAGETRDPKPSARPSTQAPANARQDSAAAGSRPAVGLPSARPLSFATPRASQSSEEPHRHVGGSVTAAGRRPSVAPQFPPAPVPLPAEAMPPPFASVSELAADLAARLLQPLEPVSLERILAGLVAFAQSDRPGLVAALATLASADSPFDVLLRPGPLPARKPAPPPAAVVAARIRELAGQLATSTPPALLATPATTDGLVSPVRVLFRLIAAERDGWQPGPADLAQALLRLPATVDPAVATAADRLTSPAGLQFAAWLRSGGLPAVTITVTGGPRRRATFVSPPAPTLPHDAGPEPAPAGVPPLLHDPVPAATVDSLIRDLLTPPAPEINDLTDTMRCWPMVLPRHRELIAATCVPFFAAEPAGNDLRAETLQDLVRSAGTFGPAMALVLANGLLAPEDHLRRGAVAAVLHLAGAGGLDAGLLGREIRARLTADPGSIGRAAGSLRQIGAGRGQHITWAVAYAVIPALLRRQPSADGLPTLLDVAADAAAATGARADLPGVADAATSARANLPGAADAATSARANLPGAADAATSARADLPGAADAASGGTAELAAAAARLALVIG